MLHQPQLCRGSRPYVYGYVLLTLQEIQSLLNGTIHAKCLALCPILSKQCSITGSGAEKLILGKKEEGQECKGSDYPKGSRSQSQHDRRDPKIQVLRFKNYKGRDRFMKEASEHGPWTLISKECLTCTPPLLPVLLVNFCSFSLTSSPPISNIISPVTLGSRHYRKSIHSVPESHGRFSVS